MEISSMDSVGLTIQTTKTQLEEKFPRIVESIVLMWGHEELDTFFAKLAVDDRGDRQGFPPEVMSDIMFLATLHTVAYPFQQVEKYANRRPFSGGGLSLL
jgi:hypothetical protein